MASRGDRSPSKGQRDDPQRSRDDIGRSRGESSSNPSGKHRSSRKGEYCSPSPERPRTTSRRDHHYRDREEDEEYERNRRYYARAREDDARREYDAYSHKAPLARGEEHDRRRSHHHSYSRAREEESRHLRADLERESDSRRYYERMSSREDEHWRDRADREDERRRSSRLEDNERHPTDGDRRSRHHHRDYTDRQHYDEEDRHRYQPRREIDRHDSARSDSREDRDRTRDRRREKEKMELASSKNYPYDVKRDRSHFTKDKDEHLDGAGRLVNGLDDRGRYSRERDKSDRDGIGRVARSNVKSAVEVKRDEVRRIPDAEMNGKRRSRRNSTPTEEDIFEKLSLKNKKNVVEAESQSKGAERRYEDEKQVGAEEAKRKNESNLNLPNGDPHVDKGRQNGITAHQSQEQASTHANLPTINHNHSKPLPRRTLVDRVLSSPTPPPASRVAEASRPASSTSKKDYSAAIEVPLSFSPVLLPHELLEAGKETLLPLRPDGKRLLPYRVTYDPKLDKSGKGKEVIRISEVSGSVKDPRKGKTPRRPARKQVQSFLWTWDQNSTKAKPPPPPSAICVSNLSPLITMPQVKQLFRNFGRFEKSELKTDPKTGESLGVAYIRFAHDYDEEGNLKEEARDAGNDQRGNEVVKKVIAEQSTIRVGDFKDIKLSLDDEGQTTFNKEWRGAMERKHGASSKKKSTGDSDKGSVTGKEGATTPMLPPPPSAPKFMREQKPTTGFHNAVSGPGFRPGVGVSPRSHFSMQRSFGSASTFHQSSSYGQGRHHYDQFRSRSSFDASPVVKSPLHSSNEKDTFLDTETIISKVREVGNSYVYIRRTNHINSRILMQYYQAFRPIEVYADQSGWYITFDDPLSAKRSSQILGEINGVRLNVTCRERPSELTIQPTIKKHPVKTSWPTKESLGKDCSILTLRSLGKDFMRDLRTRTLRPYASEFLNGVGKEALKACIKADEAQEAQESDSEVDDDVATSTISGDRVTESVEASDYASTKETEVSALATDVDEESPIQTTKKGKKSKKVIKVEVEEEAIEEAMILDQEIEEIKSAPVKTKTKTKGRKKQMTREKSPTLDPFASGLAKNDEDLYYIKLALSKLKEGRSIAEIRSDIVVSLDLIEAQNEEGALGVNKLPLHTSGSARTQGFYRIQPAQKALHLPDRNRAVVDPSSASGMASARDNRADSRRFVQGIEQHKKETATDTDILKFNQLRSRKKQLKFAKSPIHDWGLYAMELIPAGDMVIEYVGEIVRQQVADQREKNYERQGNFSTYLFRVDDDVVVDATKKGNIARLMNHCCTPNCNAKILTLNGEKRIVLFAKNTIYPGQELTYDYKFQGTGDEDDAIACLCGSVGCRRFL